MNELAKRFITEAQAALQNRKYIDAGRCYEKAAETILQNSQAGEFLRKASKIYRQSGKYKDADRCYQKAVQLLDGQQKAECLLDRWIDLIDTIVHFEYDCSFEWRGETDGSHDSYYEELNQIQKKAEGVLRQALSIKGADKETILEKASDECKKREKAGGWGASRCWHTIIHSTPP